MREAVAAIVAHADRRPAVLVVEDEILIRFAIAEHLREHGFRVLEAGNGAEAVELLAADTPVDVVFTDIEIPHRVDGITLLRWISKSQQRIPVILTSGRTSSAEAVRNIVQNAKFFKKPYRLSEIAECIRAMLIDKSG